MLKSTEEKNLEVLAEKKDFKNIILLLEDMKSHHPLRSQTKSLDPNRDHDRNLNHNLDQNLNQDQGQTQNSDLDSLLTDNKA